MFYLEFFTFFNPDSCCDNFTQLRTTSDCNALLISQLTVIPDVYLLVDVSIIIIFIFLKWNKLTRDLPIENVRFTFHFSRFSQGKIERRVFLVTFLDYDEDGHTFPTKILF